MITAVNYHLWEPCNMRCKFCFATFQDVKNSILPKGHLPEELAIQVVKELANFGFEKITFAGGEPTLCPWLSKLIQTAKEHGLTTMIVTNGTSLTDKFLSDNQNYLDWIALSVDSINESTNREAGRAVNGKRVIELDRYKEIVDNIKSYNYGLKINTVVHAKNVDEDLSKFIEYAKPIRWKVFQVLPIKGQNDFKIDEFKIDSERFNEFNIRHKHIAELGVKIVIENNDAMQGSYAMVDPAGRFYDNFNGTHNYSEPILKVGAKTAIKQVNYSLDKFEKRGGIYDWKNNKNIPSKIVVSGEVASGKSSVGKLLAKQLGYEFLSIGNMTREIAEKENLSIVEFQRLCKENPELNKEIDKRFIEKCKSTSKAVIDYRLGFYFLKDAKNIFLKIDESEAKKRLEKANRLNESHLTISERNNLFKAQFKQTYGIDYTLPENYNSVINVNKLGSPVEVVNLIIQQLSA